MQTRRFLALVLVAWCKPYVEYVPVTSATFATPTSSSIAREWDASGELPSTAEPGGHGTSSMYGTLPFFPFFPVFPVPQLDVGRGYDPRTQPIAPAYGPGGGPR